MKLFPTVPVFWSTLLVLWVLQNEAEGNLCLEEKEPDAILVKNSTGVVDYIETTSAEEILVCFVDQTNMLNCSWSFYTLEEDTQLSVSISVCYDDMLLESRNPLSVERAGSVSWMLSEDEMEYIIVHFNMTLGDKWTAHTYVLEVEKLRVLPPPENLFASFEDGNLIIRWDLPRIDSVNNSECFQYQLNISDQEEPIIVKCQKSYTIPNADPYRAYSVKVRTQMLDVCAGPPHWSEWSPSAVLEQQHYKVDPLVIIVISLGVPMILLAMLLLVRHQRLSKVLFPPIPRPPPKYKYFLERSDPQTFFHPAPPVKAEEEITEVEDEDQKLR